MYKFFITHTRNSINTNLFQIFIRLLKSDNYSNYLLIIFFMNLYQLHSLSNELGQFLIFFIELFLKCKQIILTTVFLNCFFTVFFIIFFTENKKEIIDNGKYKVDKSSIFSYIDSDTDEVDKASIFSSDIEDN